MKFLSFKHNDKCCFGSLAGEKIINLSDINPDLIDLRDAIKKQRLPELIKQSESLAANLDKDDIEFLPTITNPEKIICIGVNYTDRNAEYKDGSEPQIS